MKRRVSGLTLIAAILASCGGAAAAPTKLPTAASSSNAPATTATPTASPTAPVTATTAPSPVFAASECTNAAATTRQVIERYLALSTSGNAPAATDCFAQVWRDKHDTNPRFADFAETWSKSGPVTSVVITFVDTVNGCDRFGVNAQLSNPSAGVFQVPLFFTVGPEAGRARIFEAGTALVNTSLATTRCQ